MKIIAIPMTFSTAGRLQSRARRPFVHVPSIDPNQGMSAAAIYAVVIIRVSFGHAVQLVDRGTDTTA
jgi:hypothetical protein